MERSIFGFFTAFFVCDLYFDWSTGFFVRSAMDCLPYSG